MSRVRDTFETNTFSALRMAKAVFPSMAARKSGLIVNIGSVAGNVYVFLSFRPTFPLTGTASLTCTFALTHVRSGTPWNGLYSVAKSALHMLSDILDMECRPFNVHVMLVAPGGIRSNISRNQAATLVLPSDTLYKPFIPNVIARMHASQTPQSMPAEEFARRVVGAALRKDPPRYMTLGENSFIFTVLEWLPRALVLLFMWRRFSKPMKV